MKGAILLICIGCMFSVYLETKAKVNLPDGRDVDQEPVVILDDLEDGDVFNAELGRCIKWVADENGFQPSRRFPFWDV